jgi:hypothetical protein
MGMAGLLKRPAKLSTEVLRKAKPVRNPAVEERTVDGITVLRGPAVLKGLIGKWVASSSKETPTKQYELEEVGSYVWSLIDGKKTVEALSRQLQAKYKMNRLEADASLEAFLKMLAERGLITLLVKTK